VKNFASVGFNASTYLHRPDSLCKSQHDLETSPGSYRTASPVHCNANGTAKLNGTVTSAENVVQCQLSSSLSSGLCVSSISDGAVHDTFPHLATVQTPLPSSSHSNVIANHNKMTVSAEALKQPESNHSMLALTAVPKYGRLLPLAATRTEAETKPSTVAATKAFDVYEFRDEEDDHELSGVGLSFRQGKPSRSQPANAGTLTQKCRPAAETDAGMMTVQQNIAMIFDMDSKSIRHISLPVKTEPISRSGCIPLTMLDSSSMHLKQPAGCMAPQNNGRGKHRQPNDCVNQKRMRLNSSTDSCLAFEKLQTNSCLPNVQDLAFAARKTNKCDSNLMAFSRWPEWCGLSQLADSPAQPQSSSLKTGSGSTSVRLLDVSAGSHITDTSTSCSEVAKCESEHCTCVQSREFPVVAQLARSPHAWTVNGKSAGNQHSIVASKPLPVNSQSVHAKYTSSDYDRYGIHPHSRPFVGQHLVSCGQQKSECESKLWHYGKVHNYSAVQSKSVHQNSFTGVPFDRCNYDSARENFHQDALSSVLDLSHSRSQISSQSSVTHSDSLHPHLLPASAAPGNTLQRQISPTVTDGLLSHLPHKHHLDHYQQQQQQGLSVKKEDSEDRMMTSDKEKLMNRLQGNLIEEVPRCQCRGIITLSYSST